MASPRSNTPSESIHDEDVRQVFESCCLGRQPARILLDDEIREASFESLTDQMVQFRLLDPFQSSFTPLSLCFVTFLVSRRTCAFVGKIHDHVFPELRLSIPRQVAVAEGRMAFRVPVTKQSGLSVRVKTPNQTVWDTTANDISFAGILLAFDAEHQPAVKVSMQVAVELRLDNQTVLQVPGIIRRRDGEGRYGVFFPDSVVDGEIRPPEDLRQIVIELQRRWLQMRHD